MAVPLVKTVELEPNGYRVESATPTQVTYPYPTYYGYYGYAPMFIDLIFMMLFMMLPLMLIIPLFKALAKGFE